MGVAAYTCGMPGVLNYELSEHYITYSTWGMIRTMTMAMRGYHRCCNDRNAYVAPRVPLHWNWRHRVTSHTLPAAPNAVNAVGIGIPLQYSITRWGIPEMMTLRHARHVG